jgi:hypothetical protein
MRISCGRTRHTRRKRDSPDPAKNSIRGKHDGAYGASDREIDARVRHRRSSVDSNEKSWNARGEQGRRSRGSATHADTSSRSTPVVSSHSPAAAAAAAAVGILGGSEGAFGEGGGFCPGSKLPSADPPPRLGLSGGLCPGFTLPKSWQLARSRPVGRRRRKPRAAPSSSSACCFS